LRRTIGIAPSRAKVTAVLEVLTPECDDSRPSDFMSSANLRAKKTTINK
jgi:hypothetical protein